MKDDLTKNQGVTLVALVVTIIVLVILATVSIGMVLGNQGIFTQAEETKKIIENAQREEQEGFNKLYKQLAGHMNGNQDKPETPDLPSTAETSPYLPEGSAVIENSTLDNGLTIKDKNNNEWVWVEVPKSLTAGANDEIAIYKELEKYTSVYRVSGWTDTWYEGCGLTEVDYNTNKTKMLNSIKSYGGFWIGRYELGTDTIRASNVALTKPSFIQPDKYPYNYITCSQAQELCSELSPEANITSSMMYGIQWDLTLKFMEEKGTELGVTTADRQAKLKTDSSTWGNYSNTTFYITKGSYSTDHGKTYTKVIESYKKPTNTSVLLTTGATERNKVLNLYDIAGSEYEWTLEKAGTTSLSCVCRAGSYNTSGSNIISSKRYDDLISNSYKDVSSRPVLLK